MAFFQLNLTGQDMNMERSQLVKTVLDLFLRVTVVAILAYVSYRIARPFLPLILWGGIIAIVLSPVVARLERRFGGRKRVIALTILAGVILLSAPAVMLSGKALSSSQALYQVVQKGALEVPPPPDQVQNWPLVGPKVHAFWSAASNNLEATLETYKAQVLAFLQWLAGLVGSGLGTVLIFILSLLVAGAFLFYEEASVDFTRRVFNRLAGAEGDHWARLSAATVRSVVLGLVGIAVFQALLSYLGMLVMDVPLAPLWAVLVLFVAIVQLPPLLVMAPVAVYGFMQWNTTPAVLFAIYALLVSMSDALLKPMLLGRGVAEIPTAIILVGAIGGMILMGAIGLFLGAVILSLSYLLFVAWLDDETPAVVGEKVETQASD